MIEFHILLYQKFCVKPIFVIKSLIQNETFNLLLRDIINYYVQFSKRPPTIPNDLKHVDKNWL